MGLNLSRPTPSQPQPSQGQAPAAPQEEESYQQYDISADRQMMTQTLVNSPEVDALASQIEVYNLESIVSRLYTSIWLARSRYTTWSPLSPSAPEQQTRSPSAPTWYSTA